MMPLKQCLFLTSFACVLTVALSTVPQVIQIDGRIKLEGVSDDNVRQALDDIRQQKLVVYELDLSGNTLSKIGTADLGEFVSLRIVDLSINLIAETVDLSNLTAVHHVDLSNNLVTKVSVGPSTENLIAANNCIEKVTCFGETEKNLILPNNRVKELTDLASACRSGIVNIDLSYNNIVEIDFSELAESKESLRIMNLAHNAIVIVRNREGIAFTNLYLLDMSSNELLYLGEAFGALANVPKLNFSYNKLVSISPSLSFNRDVTMFDLRGNRFECDTLQQFYRRNEFLYKTTGAPMESCEDDMMHRGSYCCRPLLKDSSALFVDELIQEKRKEIVWNISDDENRCELGSQMSHTKKHFMQTKYRPDTSTEKLLARDGILLTKRKSDLRRIVESKRKETDEMETLLRNIAAELSLPVANTGALQIAKKVASKLDQKYLSESRCLLTTETELENCDRYIVKLKREAIRLQQKIRQFS